MIMQANRILTASQAAGILRVNENTLGALAAAGRIPHLRSPSPSGDGPQFRFVAGDLAGWLSQGTELQLNDKAYLERFQRKIEEKYPEALAKLREFDKRFTPPRKAKGYSLSKVASKKLGYTYYVRYMENGKVVPTRWSTHTNDEAAAIAFAASNRERLLAEYRQRKARGSAPAPLYAIMRRYYEKDSPYLKKDMLRGRTLGEQTRKVYHNAILNHWIPFLKKQQVRTLEEIGAPLLARFQDHCLAKGIKRQTVNHYVSFVNVIFEHLVIRGAIKANPCAALSALQVGEAEQKARGCYHVGELGGVFSRRWGDEEARLLCLVIYATGMRNSEIDRMRARDIVMAGGRRFISIPKSKTKNGERLVPLHDFVYGKLRRHIEASGKGPGDLIFCQGNGKPLPRQRYADANAEMGRLVGYGKERLEKENITLLLRAALLENPDERARPRRGRGVLHGPQGLRRRGKTVQPPRQAGAGADRREGRRGLLDTRQGAVRPALGPATRASPQPGRYYGCLNFLMLSRAVSARPSSFARRS
jgi:site-specific recombinase XerD